MALKRLVTKRWAWNWINCLKSFAGPEQGPVACHSASLLTSKKRPLNHWKKRAEKRLVERKVK